MENKGSGSALGRKWDLSLPNKRYLSVAVVLRRFQLYELVTWSDDVRFAGNIGRETSGGGVVVDGQGTRGKIEESPGRTGDRE
jgi:hypothetical protein